MTYTTVTTTATDNSAGTGPAGAPAIERRINLRAAPQRVWSALTAEPELSAWFGSGAQLEPRAGAEGWFEWEGEGRFAVRVESVDAPRRLSWRWARDAGKALDAGPSTLVEWTLQPDAAGGTVLTLRESGFSADHDRAENAFGWFDELAELRVHLAQNPWETGIRRRVELRASPARVWSALTDLDEFSAWWGPVAGAEMRSGSEGWFAFTEHGNHAVRIEAMEPTRYFAWRWVPDEKDVSLAEARQVCLVEWFLVPRDDGGTSLHLLESEFIGPASHKENTSGWDEMLPVLQRHLGEPV